MPRHVAASRCKSVTFFTRVTRVTPVGKVGRLRTVARTVLAAALAAGALSVAGPVAHADPPGGPSAAEVQHAKDEAAQRARDVAAAKVRVARTQAELERLGAAAEAAVEAWHGAQVKLADAQRKEQATRVVLEAAQEHVAQAQKRMNGFVKAAYMSGGFSRIDAIVSTNGPATFLRKMGALDVVSTQQRTALGDLAAARAYQRAVVEQAHRVTAQKQQAAAAADAAKASAQHKVAAQQAQVATLKTEEARLETLLTSAMNRAQRLEHERAQAIARQKELERQRALERAREEALRRAREAARQPVAVVGSGTGAAAVRWALTQLGVPYAWGGGDANGPTEGFNQGAGTVGFDCSGLTLYAYAHVGIYLDHWTGSQWNSGRHVTRAEARPGDLLFFALDTADPATIHHVGMYIGGGQMVEAPFTGSVVRVSNAWRSDLIGIVRPYAG